MIEAVAVTCGPMGRIAALDRVEYEYEYEYEYDYDYDYDYEYEYEYDYEKSERARVQGQDGEELNGVRRPPHRA